MKKLLQSLFVLLLLANFAKAQERIITGTVIEKESGQPLPGVSIRVPKTQIGAQTNSSGKYSITVPAGTTVLQFTFIGYTPQSIKLGSGNVINTSLDADSKALSEIVVTANAIKREKRTLGYSAPTVASDELTEGGNQSVLNSLSGRISGVNITSTSNTPGSSSRVVLRGGSSISGNNQALIVIDGVPIDNSSILGGASSLASVDFGNRGNDIDPNDIESVTILKGPAAAALYGSRASNGALIYTTKSGKKGSAKTQITYSNTTTFSSILKLPEFQNEYGQGYYDQISADGKSATYTNDPMENWSWGAPFTGEMQEWGQEIDGVRQIKPYSAQKDNVKNFFDTGFATDNNLSLSGGSDKSTFYLGLNTLNSNGTYPGDADKYDKYGVRFNGTTEFDNHFSAGISFNFTKITSNTVGGGQGAGSVYNNVLQTPRDIPLDKLGDLTNKYNAYGITDANGVTRNVYGYYGAYTTNPYYILENFNNYNEVNRVTGNFNITYKPVSWFNITERVGIDSYSDRRRILIPKFSFTPADEAGNYSPTPRSNNGSYEINQINVNEVVHDLMATASHKFSDDFEGSLMVGNNIRQRSLNQNQTGTNASGGLVVPGWYNLSNSNGPVNILIDNISKRRLVGLYADLNLSYKNMLYLEATARNDWSSTLPVKNNSFFYPSVSGSFIFTEALKNSSLIEILNYGKLRASYAQVGNDTDPYQLTSPYSKGTITSNFGSTVFPFGSVTALMAGSKIGNADLKPEKTTSFEIGTELGFLQNRFYVDFSYYRNNSKNQILSIPIPNSTGYGFSVVNAGEIQNKGVELSLRATPVKTSYGLTWELYGTYTKNSSNVVSLMPGINQVSLGGFSGMGIVAAVGHPYGEFYGVTNATDDQGRTIVSATTGRPIATSTAQYLGSYNPDYQASLGTNLKYKNWSMNVLFDTKHGGVFYSRTKDNMSFTGTSAETGGERIGVIFPNSVINTGTAASPVYTQNTSVTYNKQDYYGGSLNPGVNVIDASYVKLRTFGLSYQFNKQQLARTPFGGLTIGVFGNNLFIWTPSENKYADPEINSGGAGNEQGFDFTAQPSVRNYGFNVKVSF